MIGTIKFVCDIEVGRTASAGDGGGEAAQQYRSVTPEHGASPLVQHSPSSATQSVLMVHAYVAAVALEVPTRRSTCEAEIFVAPALLLLMLTLGGLSACVVMLTSADAVRTSLETVRVRAYQVSGERELAGIVMVAAVVVGSTPAQSALLAVEHAQL